MVHIILLFSTGDPNPRPASVETFRRLKVLSILARRIFQARPEDVLKTSERK
jgi:hypothetical protein